MKARTRILAMLLTVLMVGGILPLSLFAADGASGALTSNVSQVKPVNKTLTEIEEEFAKYNLGLSLYQTFENWAFAAGATSYEYPVNANPQSVAQNADFKTGDDLMSYLKNAKGGDKGAYSIKTEADGNVALYLGNAAKNASNSDNDNFIDVSAGLPDSFSNQRGNGSHDIYVSADFKMDGANIAPTMYNAGLFGLIYRVNNGGASYIPTVTVSEVGGLYIGGSADPDKLIGFLSDTEYTRIAISTSRADNKFYVYLNGVLVNPNGDELFSEGLINAMNTGNKTGNGTIYTAQNFPICGVRMYLVEDNTDLNSHKGLYFDNFLVGNRIAVNSSNTPYKDVFTAQFPQNLIGASVSTPLQGTTLNTKGVIWPGAVTYFQEEDGSVAMQWHNMPADSTTDKDQAYFDITNSAAKGSNLRLSMDIKLGSDGALGSTNFIFFRSTASGSDTQEITVGLDGNGKLTCDGKTLGTITKTEYSNFTIDIVCNSIGGSVVALMFFNGALVYTKSVTFAYAGTGNYSKTDYYPALIRVYPNYNGAVANLKANDLCMKAVSLTVTTDYNSASAISVFEEKPVGFVENAGITRYYDNDGILQTEDFEYGGEKYIVGYVGIIIGKESDGVEVEPYAPYEDWEHEGLIKTSPAGDLLSGGDDGSASIRPARDALSKSAKIPETGDGARLYTSYYDYGTYVNGESDHNSYVEWSFPADKIVNSNLVLDFDIMMAEFGRQSDYSQGGNTFFNFVGNSEADGSGSNSGRPDTGFLKMSSDGWFIHEGQKLVKISKTEFTRISVVINTPTSGVANATLDLYANGVKILENVAMNANAKSIKSVRFFSFFDQDISMYVKDLALYEGKKPQKFITMDNSVATATTDQSKTPAKASDIKKGFVSENNVVRYYDANGIPMAAVNGYVDFSDTTGKAYKADKNGVVYDTTSIEAFVNPGHFSLNYTIDFNEVKNGDYGYSVVAPSNVQNIFGITFNNLYFASNEYSAVKLELYIPETNKPDTTYCFELGESQRFYQVTWLGGTTYKFGDGTYFIDDADVPEGAVEVAANGSEYTLIDDRGGKRNIVCYDTDDVKGVSYDDTFYVRTRNYVKVLEGSLFSELSAGWNTVEIPIVDNGDYDIDYLAFVSDTAIDAAYLAEVKVGAVKVVKNTRFVINAEAEDGISVDGYYYKDGIAQIGWIDVNNSNDADAGDYYANPNTAKIVTGIYSIDGVWYKFDTDGKLIGKANGIEYAKNGFDKYGNVLYAYKKFADGVIDTETGLIDTGLTEEGAKVYIYTDENGVSLQNNQTINIAGAVYGFGEDGYGKLLCENEDAHVYDEKGSVKTIATCSSKGVEEFVCKICGNVKTQVIDENPNVHKDYDEKGIATCHDGDVKADGVTSVYGYSLSIGKDVSVVFYLDITGTEGELEIGRRSAFIGETTTKVNVSDLKEVTVGDKTYKTVSVSVAANAVDSVVMIRYIRPDGTFGTAYEYNVQEYIDAVVAHDVDEVFTKEVKELINTFDAYAKNVNKVLRDDGAPAEITDVNETNFDSKYSVSFNYNEKNTQTNYIKLEKTYENISFEFGETLKLKVNFILTGVSSDFKFYVNGKEVKAIITAAGYYCVETEINADELDKLVVFKVTHTGGSELTLNTSALAVAKRLLMSNTSTAAEKNLMKAIYMYNAAIEAYLTPDDAE